ncbi:hypothetical protein ABW20_dc0106130 [Dactylellina cionopaga]|nr:hypothetical protein ABW20_dc0106130 [Dactylellina cionopaga]
MEAGGGGVKSGDVKQGPGGPGGLARRLLMEVDKHNETLSDLLTDIRLTVQHHNTSSHGPFHVAFLDNLLRPHLRDHLYNQSIDGNNPSTVASSFDAPAENDALAKDKPVIVEISSDRPCAGKTQLLYHLVCVALLPESWNSINLEGKDGAVVFIDCDGTFNILRLTEIIESYVRTKLSLAFQFCKTEKDAKLNLDAMQEDIPSEIGEGELEEYLTPFHADIELKDAWNERGLRMEVVKKAGVSAWVEGAGVRKGESKKDKVEGGWLWFKIGTGGVKVGADEGTEEV